MSNAHIGIVTLSSYLIKHCCAAFLELAEGRHSNVNSFHFHQHKPTSTNKFSSAHLQLHTSTVSLQLYTCNYSKSIIPYRTSQKEVSKEHKVFKPKDPYCFPNQYLPPSTCIDQDRIVPTADKMKLLHFILLVLMGLLTSSLAAVPHQVIDSGIIIDGVIDKNYDVDSTPDKESLDHQILPRDGNGLVRRYELKCTKDRSVAPPKGFMPGRLLSDKFCQGWWDCKSDGKGLHCPVALPPQGTSWH